MKTPIGWPAASDAGVAARHGCVVLVAARPELWPRLFALTLGAATDWPAVLRLLECAPAPQEARRQAA